jgi:hypothetical protein
LHASTGRPTIIDEVITMTRRLIAGALISVMLAACAATPQATPPTASAKRPPVGCVSDTATRLPVPAGECAGFGSTYSKEDLDRTGQVYAQDALRLLDPTITARP